MSFDPSLSIIVRNSKRASDSLSKVSFLGSNLAPQPASALSVEHVGIFGEHATCPRVSAKASSLRSELLGIIGLN